MSWYSTIYIYVRNVRKRRPFIGYFLHLSLNSLLLYQLSCIAFSYYVYTYVVCMKMLTNTVQKCVYLSIYNSMFIMFIWSLYQTIFTPVVRVPNEYKADKAFDKKIKAVTPYENDRFEPYESTSEQIEQQEILLNELVQKKGLDFVETDYYGRYRYCYRCCHLKPDRSRHCSACGKCVVKFDHHCPLINKCINYGNYKFFVLYLSYMCLISVWSTVTSIEAIVRYCIKENWVEHLDEIIKVVVCAAMCILVGYYQVADLLSFHYGLIAINETTCEQAKEPVIRGDKRANYNIGWYDNFRSVFGWGLWLFPINTRIDDGLHFPVNYSRKCQCDERREVQEINKSE